MNWYPHLDLPHAEQIVVSQVHNNIDWVLYVLHVVVNCNTQ